MRRKDREMPREFALSTADKCEYAVLSMTDTDSKPYSVPISIARMENRIYFHCANTGKKLVCLRAHPQVCLVCVGDTHRMAHVFTTEFESTVIRGTASEVLQVQEKITALRLLCERHTPSNMPAFNREVKKHLAHTAVWKIEIESISGKQNKCDKNGREIKSGKISED